MAFNFGGFSQCFVDDRQSVPSLWVVLSSIVFLLFLELKFLKRNQDRLQCTLPGPRPWPIVGNIPQLGASPHVTLIEMSKQYGGVFRIKMGSRDVVIVNGADNIRKALLCGSDFAGRPDMDTFRYLLPDISLALMSHCDKWRAMKKLANNMYSSMLSSSDTVAEIVTKETDILKTVLLEFDRNGGVDLLPKIQHSLSAILYELAFGKSPHGGNEDFEEICRNEDFMRRFQKEGNLVDFFPWMQFIKLIDKRCEKMESAATSVLRYAVQEMKKTKEALSSTGMRSSLLSKLMGFLDNSKEGHSHKTEWKHLREDKEITMIIVEFLFAGSNNTAVMVCWIVLYLAHHPHCQERVRQEILQVVGRNDVRDASVLANLPYTRAFILEVFRHKSMVPLGLPHSTIRDTKFAGHFIPANTMMFPNFYSANRDPTAWTTPEQFCPERFFSESGLELDHQKVKLVQMFCFGMGRRKCVGLLLGRMIIELMIVSLVQECQFSATQGSGINLNTSFAPVMEPVSQKIRVNCIH